MTRTELIAALEAAEGPSRELDAAIRFCTVGDMYRCNFEEGGVCGNCEEPPGCGKWLGLQDERRSYPRDWRDDERLPHYTESIDAALLFTPEWMNDYGFEIWKLSKNDKRGPIWAVDVGAGQYSNWIQTFAPTPAIALCIANLRALGEAND